RELEYGNWGDIQGNFEGKQTANERQWTRMDDNWVTRASTVKERLLAWVVSPTDNIRSAKKVAKISKSSHTLEMRFAFSLLTLFCFCVPGCKRENSDVPKYSAEEVRSIEQEANQGNAESAYLRGTIEEQGLSGPANAARAR